MLRSRVDPPSSEDEAPEVEVVIEVPRGSFLKRGATGRVDFVSPLPCPFNYGSVPNFLGLEGDLLDALVLGPRLPFGTRLRVRAWGAVTLTDRGMSDDKLICSAHALTPCAGRGGGHGPVSDRTGVADWRRQPAPRRYPVSLRADAPLAVHGWFSAAGSDSRIGAVAFVHLALARCSIRRRTPGL